MLITWGVSLVAVRSYNPDQAFYDFLALEMQAMFVIELIFLAVGLLLGCAMKQYKRSGSTAVAIILTTYFMSILSTLNANLDFLKYFTPFKYFDASELYRSRQNGRYVPAALGVPSSLSVWRWLTGSITGAIYIFNSRGTVTLQSASF